MKQAKQTKIVPHDNPLPKVGGFDNISCRLGTLSLPFPIAAWFFYCFFFGSILCMEAQLFLMAVFLCFIGFFPVIFGLLALRKLPGSKEARIGITFGGIVFSGGLFCGLLFFLSISGVEIWAR